MDFICADLCQEFEMKILILHGPNLNFLGVRKPEIYGSLTLSQVNGRIRSFAAANKVKVRIFQSNCEGTLIDLLGKNRNWADWLVINPGAYTHYSYALRDAIEACGIPAVETHMTDINKREAFRKKSVIKPVCRGQIAGLGVESYLEALKFCLAGSDK